MKYSELPETPKAGICLHCEMCDNDYSATRGDYWDRLDEVALCECGELLTLMRKVISYREVKL